MISFPKRCYSGTISAIPSKSDAHRKLIADALSDGKSTIKNIYLSEDIKATMDSLISLGAAFSSNDSGIEISPIPAKKDKAVLHVRESGSTLRFLIPLASIFSDHTEFIMEGRLKERPLSEYGRIFREQGLYFSQEKEKLIIEGSLKSGRYELDGSISSQFLTGLLFALPLLEGNSIISVNGKLSSIGYVRMTLKTLSEHGIIIDFNEQDNIFTIAGNQRYKAINESVENDFSQAAFFLCAGCLSNKGITVKGLNMDSLQPDRRIVEILKQSGANIAIHKDSISAFSSDLRHCVIDIDDCPDLGPALMALGCHYHGGLHIKGIRRLRLKESDRVMAMKENLKKLSIDMELISDDECYIHEGRMMMPQEELSSYHDHRIFMALAMMSEECPITIDDEICLNKSFPTFLDIEQQLRGDL